ncbi:MAG: Ig-like domain-containing protein [Propionibacteriaceae bacterium]|jgi:hypothetical protein|nr:Ig-like domain-containing protein [Propionibacteriaceae bacterium]
MRHALRTVLLFTAVLVLCSSTSIWATPAYAAPVETRIGVDHVVVDGETVTASGSVRAVDGQGVSGLLVAILLDGQTQGTAISGDDGFFTFSFVAPGVGEHIVEASWVGDSRYLPVAGAQTLVIEAPAPHVSEVTVVLNPVEAPAGAVVTVTGTLIGDGVAITDAAVKLSSTYGTVDALVATDAAGAYSASVSLPDAEGFPSTYTITAEYAGDEVYASASGQAVGSIVAAPSPSVEPVVSDTASPSVGPEATADTGSTGTNDNSRAAAVADSRLSIVAISFAAVALIALGVLIILGLVSHRNKRLSLDERRGFGTDFGQRSS